MQRSGGAVILMQQSSIKDVIDFTNCKITYAVGNCDILKQMQLVPTLTPFSESVITLLNNISKELLADREAKAYPDVITLAFWMRRASTEALKNRFFTEENNIKKQGRGIVFHISPSNVPVNFAYSLVTGLLCGNANIVRIPSKDFPQVNIICRVISKVLDHCKTLAPYIVLVKYGHDSSVNDAFSSIADVRVVWGGNNTIAELRKSPIKPRATEITFTDRFSLVVIDSDKYMKTENKVEIANSFYNDTYLTDQNACTSPRVVVWMGSKIRDAKQLFWKELQILVDKKYEIQGVQAVNKLTSSYLLAVAQDNVKKEVSENNLIVRMKVESLTSELIELKDNSGYFFEYECQNIMELSELCNDSRCQTVSYMGDKEMFVPLITSGIRGIDRIVPIGKTMDFDLIWDGYNLFERLTRNITLL